MTPLGEKLIARIRAAGPVTVADYMAACLGDPAYGYYMRREPFGRYGDFVTAPEVSQMFGELIGVWAIVAWESLGSPRRFVLAELGPGRGTLMADLARIVRVKPAFPEAVEIHLVETSPRLRAVQEKTLAGTGMAIRWHESIATLPELPTIIVANEFFDALPVRQFVWSGEAWSERMIGLGADGKLTMGLRPVDQPSPASALPAGAVVEISPIGTAIMGEIAGRLARLGGAALVIDYGSDRPGFGDTLQAVQAHQYADPLAEPGEADLTAHVDFTALAKAARASGAETRPVITQAVFLDRLGLARRAGTLMAGKDEATRKAIEAAVERLTGPKAMGDLFKVLAIGSPGLALPGFDS